MLSFRHLETRELMELLATQRRHFAHLQQQAAYYGPGQLPFSIANQLREIEESIDSIDIELLSRKDYIRSKRQSLGHWTFLETKHLASDEVLENLHRYNNQEAFAVDDGVLLYLPRGFGRFRVDLTKIVVQRNSLTEDVLTNPTEEDLFQAGIENYGKDIQSYLRLRAKGGAEGKFQTKVGLLRIDYPVDRIDQPLTIHLVPLSYWVVREFNRRILDDPDAEILSLRNDSLSKILSTKDSVTFPCPSALYVEVCIVTQDRKLIVLEKNRKLSALARKGLSWTCTLEEGLVWAKDIHQEYIDFDAVIKRGLKLELDIKPDDIDAINYYGIALEHTHLNSAIIGIMMLNVPARDLESRIRASEDFGLGYHFVNLDSVFQELFLNTGNGTKFWHPTGRLRAVFALYHLGDAAPSIFSDPSSREAYFSRLFERQPSAGTTTQLQNNQRLDLSYQQEHPKKTGGFGNELGIFNPTIIINNSNVQENPMSDVRQYHFGKGDNVAGNKTLNQFNNSSNLVQAARDIKELLDQLSKDYPSDTLAGQAMIGAKAIEQIEQNPTLRQRVINALKEAGATALEEAVDHPAVKIVVAGAKGFVDAQ